jgi:hypothetical protein
MQLVFDKTVADQLSEKYTVVELETLALAEGTITAWCVLPAEKIFSELDVLPMNLKTHQDLLAALGANQPDIVLDLCASLMGKFGGELDSFYEELTKRIHDTGSCEFVAPVNS